MGNLALNKLPIEKDKWTRPEEATDGNILGYDSHRGFAAANWPCTYTLDLDMEYKLNTIRFLLWDDLGKLGNKQNARKYKFIVSISNDGVNFITVYSNQNQDGSNGWFSFRFINDTYARYVRLTGLFNTANEQIHIVEFEIHDQEPTQLSSSNIHSIDIANGMGMPSEERMSELISNVLSKKSTLLEGAEQQVKTLGKFLKQSEEAIKQIEFIKETNDFTKEAIDNESRATKWLVASVVAFIFFVGLLAWFVFYDNQAKAIILDASSDKAVQPYTTLFVSAYYVTKGILLSTLLFIFGWLLKNYRSEKHNYIINKHKAMTLTVATGILTKENYKSTDSGNIFILAMQIIFTHQSSGFSKDDGSSPNVLNSVLQRGVPKINAEG